MNKKFFSVLLTFVVFGGFIYWIWTLPIPWYIQLSISIATIGIRLIIFALIDAKPLPVVAGDEYQSFTSRNTSLSLHPTTKLTLIKMLNFSLVCLGAYVFLVWVAPALYAVANPSHPSEHKKGTYTKGNIVTDVEGNTWQEYKLDIDKEWSSFEFTEGPKSHLWAGKDSIFVLFRGSNEPIIGYTGEMQNKQKKPRRVPFYSNYFDVRLPEVSEFEHDQLLFWLRVN